MFLYFNHKKIVNPELDIKKWENGWVVLDGKIDLGDKEILKILNTLQVEERKEIFEELKKEFGESHRHHFWKSNLYDHEE